MKLSKKNYAVIDLETGGFSKSKNGICEIAIVIVDHQKNVQAEYSALIKPYKRIDSDELVSYHESAMKVNGILMEDLINGEDAEPVAKEVVGLLEKYNIDTIIGHNAKRFDKPRLEYFLCMFGYSFVFDDCIDTMDMAKAKFGNKNKNSLTELCKQLNIENKDSHRALGDAMATLEILKKLEN